MNLPERYAVHCQKFFSEKILMDLSEVLYDSNKSNPFKSKDDIYTLLSTTLMNSTPKKKKLNTPKKNEQLWLSPVEYKKTYDDGKILCSYAPIRGQNVKKRYCGITMSESDLEKVNGDRLELRCNLCNSGPNGSNKPKTGCGRKLFEELCGKEIAPTTLSGVNVPNNTKALMGFVSGTTELNLNDTKSELVVKNFKGLKTEKTESFTDFGTDYDETGFNWVIRMKDNEKIVIGKTEDNLVKGYDFKENYEDNLIELSEEEIDYCENTFNLTYKFYNKETYEVFDYESGNESEIESDVNDDEIMNALNKISLN